MCKQFALCAALLMLLAVSAVAQISAVPTQMSFQGRLTKPDGSPLPDTSTASLTFHIFAGASGGTALWSQTSSNVAVHNGAFSVKLDYSAGFTAGQSLGAIFNGTPYLEIQVAPAASPLTPRQPITTNAFAFKAGSVSDGSVTLSSLASGVLNYSNISGTVGFNQLAPSVTSYLAPLNNFGYGPEYFGTVATPGGLAVMATANGYLYTLSPGSGNSALNVYRASSASSSQLIASRTLLANSNNLVASGNYVYILSVTASGTTFTSALQIVDVTTPAAPIVKGTYTFPGSAYAYSIAVSGNFAYVVNQNGNALQIINVSNPAAPVLVGGIGTDSTPVKVTVSGGYAYVINYGASTLQTFSVSAGGVPTAVGRVATNGPTTDLLVAGGYAYVSGSNSIQTYSLANPAAPVSVASNSNTSGQSQLAYYADSFRHYLFALNNNGEQITVFDLSAPAAPALLGAVYTPSSDYALAISGGVLYASSGNTLDIFSVYSVLQFNSSLTASGNISTLFDLTVGGNAEVSGNLFVGKNITTGGAIAATGNLSTAANLTAMGTITGSSLTSLSVINASGGIIAGGPVSGGSLSTTGTLSVGLTATTGALTASSLSTTGALTVGGASSTTGNAQAGSLTSLGGVSVDKNNVGDGTIAKGISFGNASGEGIASKRTAAPNQFGVDLMTNYAPRLSVTNGGNVGINTQTPAAILDVNGTIIDRSDLRMIQRGGGAGNNGGQGRALVDAGLNQSGVGATGLHINFANDFGQVNIDSDTYVSGKVYSNGVALTSDVRYKKNILTLENSLKNLLNLRGVTYDFDREKWTAKNFPEGKQIGFIAQEVERIFPELVLTDANGYKSVLYQNAVPILVEGMKAQQKQIDAQKREIEALKTDNADLRKQSARISELEKNLADVLTALKQMQKAQGTDTRK